MYPAQVLRLIIGQQPLNEGRYAKRSGGVFTFAGCERSRDKGVEGAINQRIPVNKEETG